MGVEVPPVGAVIIGLVVLALLPCAQPAHAQSPPGITRTDLQRHPISVVGREVVQVRVDFARGAAFPRHHHPGEEIVYALKGLMEYTVEGRPPVTLRAGEVLFIPAGAIHAVRNVGNGPAAELATYIVRTGQPLVVLEK
jgi:quercetin dioxygenase-like cupin family protein